MSAMYDRFNAILEKKNMKPADLTRITGISSTVFSEWKKGKSTPKTEKLVMIAKAIGTTVEYLVTGNASDEEAPDGYYQNPETARVAQEIYDDPSLHALFDAARDAKPEDLRMAANMLKRFKGTNPNG